MGSSDTYDALLVDDEPTLRQAMARAFKRCGFRCDLAGDGRQALQMLSDRRYHVVITDLNMPDVNGHRLAVELLGKADRPVVIVVTGVTEPKLERDLRARGVDDILFKPVDYANLAARAAALVELRATKLARTTSIAVDSSALTMVEVHVVDAGSLPVRKTDEIAPLSCDVGNVAMTAAAAIQPVGLPAVHVQAVQEPTAQGTDERIARLESDLERLAAKQEPSRVWLLLAGIGGVALGWILAMWSK